MIISVTINDVLRDILERSPSNFEALFWLSHQEDLTQDKVILVAAFGSNLVDVGLNAGKFISSVAKRCGGGGGGRANIAQAGGLDSAALNDALELAKENLIGALK